MIISVSLEGYYTDIFVISLGIQLVIVQKLDFGKVLSNVIYLFMFNSQISIEW